MWPIMQTPNRASLSMIGLYNWDDSIFNLLQLPSGMDADLVTQNILAECGELEVMYPDWDFMYNAIGYWSSKELPTWERIYKLAQMEYNPIENYDRIENALEQENTKDNRMRLSSSTSKGSSNSQNDNTNKVAGINTNTLAAQSGSTGNTVASSDGESSLNENDQGITDRGLNRTSRIHGNIGVTTSQQMAQQELDIAPQLNVVNYIVNAFKQRFCLLVY